MADTTEEVCTMNRFLNVSRFALALAGASALLLAARAQAQDPVTFSDVVDLAATVTAIDRDDREISLRGPQGREVSVTAGPEVRNFAQLEVGDTIRLHYELVYAAEKLDPDAVPDLAAAAAAGAVRAEEGERPGGAIGAIESTVVLVESIGPDGRTATFFTPDGALQAIVVEREEGRAFARALVPGDLVQLTVAEAVAIYVEAIGSESE
jgi:hypothetical protein